MCILIWSSLNLMTFFLILVASKMCLYQNTLRCVRDILEVELPVAGLVSFTSLCSSSMCRVLLCLCWLPGFILVWSENASEMRSAKLMVTAYAWDQVPSHLHLLYPWVQSNNWSVCWVKMGPFYFCWNCWI